jgi:hypothetical protein
MTILESTKYNKEYPFNPTPNSSMNAALVAVMNGLIHRELITIIQMCDYDTCLRCPNTTVFISGEDTLNELQDKGIIEYHQYRVKYSDNSIHKVGMWVFTPLGYDLADMMNLLPMWVFEVIGDLKQPDRVIPIYNEQMENLIYKTILNIGYDSIAGDMN